MKTSLAFFALLLLASCAEAQQQHRQPAMATSSGYTYDGWGGSIGYGAIGGSTGRAVVYVSPRIFAIGYVKNDGDWSPAPYMKYEEALALGKKMLAEAELAAHGEGTPSLGEVARMYRAARVPTLRLQAKVSQDNSGNLQVCNLNGNDCHRP